MPDATHDTQNQNIKKLNIFFLFRSVTQSTNTHTGIGTLRNETKRNKKSLIKKLYLRGIFQELVSNNRQAYSKIC